MKKQFSLFLTSLIFGSTAWADNSSDQVLTDFNLPAIESEKPVVIDAAPLAQPLADAQPTTEERDTFTNQEKAINISNSLRIVSAKKHFQDEALGLTINASYPQIEGKTLSVNAKKFNKIIEQSLDNQVAQFKKNIAIDSIHMQTLPPELRKSSLHVDYDVDVVKPKNQTLLSIRLSTEEMHAGRAHPFHSNRVINFDLTTGKVLALNELFKKNTKFLQLLAAYTQKTLDTKLKHDNWMVAHGTKPDANNFRNWNLQADSLLITFDEYQVAPYTYGAQEVEVPYSELKKMIAKSAPIAACANNAANCVG